MGTIFLRSPFSGHLVLALVTLIMTDAIYAVDRGNFKTCDQSAFCRRHRNVKEGDQKWLLVPDSVSKSSDGLGLQAELKDQLTGVPLKLTLSAVKDGGGILRMLIDEPNSERKRFEAKLSLADDLQLTSVDLVEKSEAGLTATFGDGNKVVINSNPFRVDLFKNGKLVISGNQRGLMKFEHFRHKPENEQIEDGMWEETYKSHTDSKPYGPMSVGMDFTMVGMEHVYGIPEHADSFSLKNTKGTTDPYRLYNLDVFEYETQNPMALYGSIPMMMAHSEEMTVGMLWLNPSETWIDIEPESNGVVGLFSNLVSGDSKSRLTHWISETGLIDVWFMMGPTPQAVLQQNAKIAGVTPLPPIYSIGYHQCRWNYFTQEEVSDVDKGFDDHDIPLDAIWLDIEYTEGRSKKYFTWDPVTFSDHKTLISNLTTKGRRLIAIIDPHLKKDTNYPTYNEAVEKNYLIKNKDGSDYEGWCWPGASMWADYLNPEVSHWWSNKFQPEFFPGFPEGVVDIWNDMNEPSVFNGPEITAPKDVKHFNDWEHRDVHNIYGMLMTKATHTGLVTHRPNLRPFILTRAFFVGSQRYCAAWTGDNMCKWDHLQESIPMILSLSVAGMTFSGADVPGFFFNPESTEIVVRWYQMGAFQPFFRAHAHLDTKRREPWLFDEQTKQHIRQAIRTRYTYLPYMYTLFRENSINGMPPMRPLWFQFPKDTKTFALDKSFLLGDSLLVQPAFQQGQTSIDAYFPGDETVRWYDIEENITYDGGKSYVIDVPLSKIPHFQRSGSIIPRRERIRRSAALATEDPISLDIVLDDSAKNADGQLYLDDGSSFEYRQGKFVLAAIRYDKKNLSYTVTEGQYNTQAWLERVTFYRFPKKPLRVTAVVKLQSTKLDFKYDQESKILVIRKPELNMSASWRIVFE